ncbi:MAG TPA: dienelactone hydrolase family protein [Rhodocyclaceae bacterium]|nr:dienelactone hydrolase family protein [Rhodocyclaceae bacterium]
MDQQDFDSLLPELRLNRRDFIATTLGGGFALAVQPIMAQTLIQTDSEGLTAGFIQIPVSDGMLEIYRAAPDQGKNLPTVLVISEIFGVHAYIQDVCRRLAKLGYLALAPNLFARQGDPAKYTTSPEIQANVISKVPDAQVKADLDALVAWAAKNIGDPKRLAITGFCWGGRITWLYANHNPAIKAGVAWYGRLRGEVRANTPRHPLDQADNMQVPVLGLYGGQDQGIPNTDVDAMNAKLKAAGGKSYIHVYPDAPHAFHADYRPNYRAAEAKDGWQRMLAWFRQNGV